MVDTWREPYAVVQCVLDLLRGEPEGRGLVAVDLHIDLRDSDLQVAGHVLQLGDCRIFASRSAALLYSSSVSGLCRVNWYWLLVSVPPMRIDGRFCMNILMPGTFANLRPEFLDDLVGGELPLVARFQPHEDTACSCSRR